MVGIFFKKPLFSWLIRLEGNSKASPGNSVESLEGLEQESECYYASSENKPLHV